MKTIFDALREEHDIQRSLAEKLITTHGDSEERDELYTALKCSLEAHAAAEERCFYAPLIQHDMTLELSRHGIAEHHELDELIEKLDETDRASSAWLMTAKDLHEKVVHHLAEEEQDFFPLAGKVLSEKQKTDLAEEYACEIEEQKTERV